MQLTGTVTLSAHGDPSAVFIFKAVSTLITASNSTVSLINGASPGNVYWQVGSSTTLGADTTFVGTVMSLTSTTLATGASVQGRVLARNGSVTLDTNTITRPNCAVEASPTPSPSPSPSASSSPTATPSPSSSTPPSPTASASGGSGGGGKGGCGGNGSGSGSGGNGNGNGDGSGGNGDEGGNADGSGSGVRGAGNGSGTGTGSGSTLGSPVVPVGHPETGLGGGSGPAGPGWFALWLLGGSAAAAAALRWRRPRAVRPS